MSDVAELAVDGLAVYRITRLLTVDKLLERPRATFAELGPTAEYLSGCPACVSVWVAAGVALVHDTKLWRRARLPLAWAAITGLLAEFA